MAISFQSKLDQQSATTVAFDVGSSAGRFLVVNVMRRAGTTIGVTYNGVALTQLGSLASLWSVGDTSFIFYLASPASGSNDVVVTHDGTLVRWTAACYNGADGTPANFTTAQSASAAAQSVSVNPTNPSWIIGGGWFGGGGFATPDANTTHRTADNSSAIFDSNSVQSSAYAIGYSDSVAGDLLGFALKPLISFSVLDTLSLAETIISTRTRLFTTAESLSLLEVATARLGRLFTISESLSLAETTTMLRTRIFTVAESLGLVEVLARIRFLWTNQDKNTTTWTDQTKNSSSWTNQSKS